MKKFLVFLLLVITGCLVREPGTPPLTAKTPRLTKAASPQKVGYDVLGVAKYCNTFLQAPLLPQVSTVLNVFGDPMPCIEQRIAKGGITDVQVDLMDATCFRNGVCPPGTPSLTDWGVMATRARHVNQSAIQHTDITWWVSPYLEHDIHDNATIQKACQVALKECPTCKCLNSPVSGATPPGIPVERHGTKVRSFSVSGDGSSMFDGDTTYGDGNGFEFRTAGENQTYAWFNELNLRCTGEKVFVPVAQRTNRPELWQFQIAYKLMTSQEDVKPLAPPQCRNVRSINGGQGEISKPLAEKYCNKYSDDGRGNKNLLILRRPGKSGERLPIFNPRGKEVGCFKYFGPYSSPGLYRYYVGSCSGQNPWELYQSLNNEWGFVGLGNGNCLLFNSIRRIGSYR